MNAAQNRYHAAPFRQWERTLLPDITARCLSYDGQGRLWAGTADGTLLLNDEGKLLARWDLRPQVLFPGKDGTMLLGCGAVLWSMEGGKSAECRTFPETIRAIAARDGLLLVLTAKALYRYDPNGDRWSDPLGLEGGEGTALAAFGGKIFAVTSQGWLLSLAGKREHWKPLRPGPANPFCPAMPQGAFRALRFDSLGHLWAGGAFGLAIFDTRSFWRIPDNTGLLPREPAHLLTFDESGGRWLATDCGVILLRDGERRTFGAQRWLPSCEITALTARPDGTAAWAATPQGLVKLSCREVTLREKAAHFQRLAERYFIRDVGFCMGREDLQNDDISTGHVEISDNDGLWTAYYCVAQSCRFAATGDEEARTLARRSMEALLCLHKITGLPGFPARAIRHPGEKGYGNGDPEWPLAADGVTEWKRETSSDEVSGHFWGLTFYWLLCADEDEKAKIAAALQAVADHILEHGCTLCDIDGQPTTWGNWSPEALNGDDTWSWERGINSFELLCYCKAVAVMTGKTPYGEAIRVLTKEHHYWLNALQHKMFDGHASHIDDSLGFFTAMTYFELEDDPDTLALCQLAMEHHWQYERIEASPLWNLIYGAYTGRRCDVDAAVQGLQDMVWDPVCRPVQNTNRKDLVWDTEQAAWNEPPQLMRPLPYHERDYHKFDGNPFRPDSNCHDWAEDPANFLLPYWFGRWKGLIDENS